MPCTTVTFFDTFLKRCFSHGSIKTLICSTSHGVQQCYTLENSRMFFKLRKHVLYWTGMFRFSLTCSHTSLKFIVMTKRKNYNDAPMCAQVTLVEIQCYYVRHVPVEVAHLVWFVTKVELLCFWLAIILCYFFKKRQPVCCSICTIIFRLYLSSMK